MPGKTAALIGGTGLIGNEILSILQNDPAFEKVRLLSRRLLDVKHPRVEVKLVNFDDAEMFKMALDGCQAVFCAVGTTQKKVRGDLKAYRKVDVDIPVKAARFCAELGGEHFLVVSSIGADADKRNFYLKMKGQMEDAVLRESIPAVSVFRPSQLLGHRSESRPRETVVAAIVKALRFAIPKHYKPIEGSKVAQVMVQVFKDVKRGKRIFENEDILDYPAIAGPHPESPEHA